MARRPSVSQVLGSKIAEALEGAQRKIIETAVESLIAKGAEATVSDLKIDFQDASGKKMLSLVLSGKIRIEPKETEKK